MHVVGRGLSSATMQCFLLLSLSRVCKSFAFAPKRMVWTRGPSLSQSPLRIRIDSRGESEIRLATKSVFGNSIARRSTRRYGNADANGNANANTIDFSTSCIGEGLQQVSATEIELSFADGMIVRGQRWAHCNLSHEQTPTTPVAAAEEEDNDNDNDNDKQRYQQIIPSPVHSQTTRILALHGWLDNCRSFHYIAPRLVEKLGAKTEIVAIDLPGHGRSSHRPIEGPTTVLSEGVYYVAEVLDALGWGEIDSPAANNDENNDNEDEGKVVLMGHSMGGGMAVIYAGVFPEQISHVVSLDIFGPEPGTPKDAAAQIRSHVVHRRGLGPLGRPHALYPSLERAIERRMKSARMAPGGHQYLSLEASTELVTRSTIPVYANATAIGDGNGEEGESLQGYKFRHDARLLWPSLQYLTAEQIESILERVDCQVCLLAAEDGYPFPQDRIDRVVARLEPEMYEILPGSHHFHADPDTAGAVVEKICEFFAASSNGAKSKAKAKPSHETLAQYGMQ